MSSPPNLLAERNRLLILTSLLAAEGPLEFVALLDHLGLSKGNLSTHLRRLEEAGLIEARKEFIDRKPRSSYRSTESGRRAVEAYLREVEMLIQSSLKQR
jgi:DNA-binding HxlR family transcriptional regulator